MDESLSVSEYKASWAGAQSEIGKIRRAEGDAMPARESGSKGAVAPGWCVRARCCFGMVWCDGCCSCTSRPAEERAAVWGPCLFQSCLQSSASFPVFDLGPGIANTLALALPLEWADVVVSQIQSRVQKQCNG